MVVAVLLASTGERSLLAQELSFEERVDSIFEDVSGATSPGCAVSVMRQGALIYERGYGMANLEYGIPITPHSVFHVASVSKQFTAMAVELLVNEGKVSWDDDIRTYVPEVPDLGETITLRHLAHHTSGIRDQWSLLSMAGWRSEADVITQQDVLDITSRQTALNFEPGEQFLYSNTGFTLLAVVVERVTGQTLREFTTQYIFEPLGMEATHFHDDHNMIVRSRAWGYAPDSEGEFGLRNSIPAFDVVGATSLFTTAHDMAAWDRNFITGQVGGAEALSRMRRPFRLNDGELSNYGHGLQLETYGGLRVERHGGADAGFRSNFERFPDQGFSTAVLCNYARANPTARAGAVARVYLADQMDGEGDGPVGLSSETVPMSHEDLMRFTGSYRGNPGQVWPVLVENDQLRFDGAALRPLGENRFEVIESAQLVTFVAAEGGEIVALEGPPGRLERIPPWEPQTAELAEFTGTYRSAELGTDYRLVMEGAELWLHHRKLDAEVLWPIGRDEFGFGRGGSLARFTRDERGSIDGFTISNGRVWGVRFDRVEG
jgi:CubicO group peptidase (beta-lactamase class C family)